MKRRLFIITASSVAASLPVVYYINKQKRQGNPLTTTDLLGSFCDDKTLQAIGNSYRTLMPQENEKQKLIDIILLDAKGKKFKTSNSTDLKELITRKVNEDFLTDNTMIIKGWVISKTEARQCALFSFA
jgi:hypothetical protein